jgi:two-component system sensor histidine kinase RegB
MPEPVTPQYTLDASLAINARRLWVLRNVEMLTQLAVIGLAIQVLGMPLPLPTLLTIIALLALLNLVTWMRLRHASTVSTNEFFLQVAGDVVALTGLLYFSGGSTNPFISLYLLPLVIVAATLPAKYAWRMAGLTIGCYSLLLFYYVPLPKAARVYLTDFHLHIFGMWFGFIVSVSLIIFFVMTMANTLRERDRILAETRERALRDEHLVALGTLAAGTAHELGTPLATMAVLAADLAQQYADTPDLGEKTRILREQTTRCKEILSTLSARTGEGRAESGRRLALDRYLETLLTEWHATRPDATLKRHLGGPRPAPHIVADKTLDQAIMNVLNNAADASVDSVEVNARWSPDRLEFDVCDRGPGLAPGTEARIGTPFFTTKQHGQGLGLFLARAVLNRFGGTLRHTGRDGGGTCARIILPVAKILAEPTT